MAIFEEKQPPVRWIVLLIASTVWKCKLMKEEQALIAQGKEAAA